MQSLHDMWICINVRKFHLLSILLVDYHKKKTTKQIQKLKNPTYMLSFQEKLATLSHIVTMADFAMAMKKKLADINLHSFNDFKMKIGKCESGIQ